MSIVVFIVILFALFGPKLSGVVDLSVLGGVIGALLLCRFKRIELTREYAAVITIVAIVFTHSMLVVLLSGVEDMQPILRHLRALISTALLGIFFYNAAVTRSLSAERLARILITVLLVNAAVILVSIASPAIKPFFAKMYGFNKGFVSLRGFGLTAGYDTAGYLCVFGMVLSAAAAYYKRNFAYSVIIIIFMAAAIFTSRSAMLLAFLSISLVCAVFLYHGRWALKVSSLVYIAIGVSVVFYYVGPLILSTLGPGLLDVAENEFSSEFAVTDLSSWRATMWVLPDTVSELIFGAGEVIESSDVGYVRMIFMVGVVGLAIVMLLYAYMLIVTNQLRRMVRRGDWRVSSDIRILLVVLLTIIPLLYVINVKNLYFLTRGYHELVVILFFFLLGSKNSNKWQRVRSTGH